MPETTQLIKEKLDIVEFIRHYVELKPAGKNFKACCPFHKEKTPSFMVSPDRQTWHCFGSCSEGGDIITFLMKYENLEFYDALKILAEKAGVEIQRSAGGDFNANDVLYKIISTAKDFFKANLVKSEKVKEYLEERGLTPETVEEFELGLAIDGHDTLIRHLLRAGFKITDIEKAGMIFKTEQGTFWDRFRARLMFPIYNHIGKPVGFTGRVLPWADDGKSGKYVNSPETPIFQKSKFLYGFHKTKNDIREAKIAVLVEGQMDFLMTWQDGVKNIVATSGTALTNDHLIILRRLADELILSFDSDEAGQLAIERSIDLAGALDIAVKILQINNVELKDPADVARKTPGAMKDLVMKAIPAMEYYFKRYLGNNASDDFKNKKQGIRITLSKIAKLTSAVERSYWIKKLSSKTGFDESVLLEEMGTIKDAAQKVRASDLAPQKSKDPISTRKDLISQRLLGIVFNNNELKTDFEKYLEYLPLNYQNIYKAPSDDEAAKIANLIGMKFTMEVGSKLDEKNLKKEFIGLLKELKMISLKEVRQKVSEQIKNLENSDDINGLAVAMKEFDRVSKEMHNLGM